MVSDDLFASLTAAKPAFDPMATQKLPPNSEQTQRLSAAETTQRVPNPAESTHPSRPTETAWNPEATQQLDPPAKPAAAAPKPDTGVPADAETTQRIDDSIWRLQEAKRILSGIPQK
jgi:hypothetical protein